MIRSLAVRAARGTFAFSRPADLPVEQPTHFDLIVNRGAARTLGIVIPASVLSRAPKFVE